MSALESPIFSPVHAQWLPLRSRNGVGEQSFDTRSRVGLRTFQDRARPTKRPTMWWGASVNITLSRLPLNAEHSFPQETGLNGACVPVGSRKELAVNPTLPEVELPYRVSGTKTHIAADRSAHFKPCRFKKGAGIKSPTDWLTLLGKLSFHTVRRNVYKLYLQYFKIPRNWGRSLR